MKPNFFAPKNEVVKDGISKALQGIKAQVERVETLAQYRPHQVVDNAVHCLKNLLTKVENTVKESDEKADKNSPSNFHM
ncbi:MAG: hypothetical protein CMF38_05905 [Legionellaceae bacterium]|nr:hypothetical protein [Legionellaceae bacterium]HCA89321.1 hypothetical protein [Legionellales bacterium]|tara:strand:+ start:1704 stop:1940 length:237 start_codon:yes stop_codon:yes gene_type:complete